MQTSRIPSLLIYRRARIHSEDDLLLVLEQGWIPVQFESEYLLVADLGDPHGPGVHPALLLVVQALLGIDGPRGDQPYDDPAEKWT
jgi:hypothetical protein